MSEARTDSYLNVCDQCYRRKLGCSRAKPTCDRCHQAGRQCTYSLNRPVGRPRLAKSQRRGSRSFSISNVKHSHSKEQPTGPVYVGSEQVTTMSASNGDKCNAQMISPAPSTAHSTNSSKNGPMPPKLFVVGGSESNLIDPAICSEPPGAGQRPENSERAPDYAMHGQERSASPNQSRKQPQPGSVEEIYRHDFRSVSQLDAELCTTVASRHTPVGTHQMTAGFEAEMLDFNFESNEPFVMQRETFETDSMASSHEDGCTCLSDLVQSLEARVDLGQTMSGSLEVIRMLNEASERLVHCNESHGGIFYSILLGIYEEAEDGLGMVPGYAGKSDNETYLPTTNHSVVPDKANRTASSQKDTEISVLMRDTIFKAFTTLSMVAAALIFKLGANLGKGHQEVVAGYADMLRDRFKVRLTAGAALRH